MLARFITRLMIIVSLALLSACNEYHVRSPVVKREPDRLFVYPDGSMMFRDRFVHEDDVVIYDDGRGGERAAVKMVVPLHPDFYRDSIHVVRKEAYPGEDR